ncbi:MAG: hypothetical protein K8J31_21825 [Anaerolineae bacterium]|nr:hypothetical protein [Anaerolineae bacterium]
MIDEFSSLIEARTGLSVDTRFRADLQEILQQVAAGDLPGLHQTLRQTQVSAPKWQALIQALTIGETYFLRDTDTFHLLRTHMLPALIRARREARQLELHIWCAGCATGEEPYSVAMTLLETLPDWDRWQIHLIGTDLNMAALDQARAGIYRDWSFRHCPPDLKSRYFEAVSAGWRIRPPLRDMVTFQHLNLIETPPLPQADIIFCRNVLIYLTRPRAAALEEHLHAALNPGGWLLLGSSEALRAQRDHWITHVYPNLVLYQKPTQPLSGPVTRRHPEEHPLEPIIANGQANGDLYRAAVNAVHTDQTYEAERLLAELLADNPNHAGAHTLLAFIFANRSAVPEAQAHLDTALRIDTMLGDAHYLRAALYLENGERARAERALRAALYCQRDHPLATFLMGILYAQAGDLPRASRAWRLAQALASALPPQAPISDLSDMTAAAFGVLVQTQLDSVQG